MSDLIDRQAAIDAVNEWLKLYAINRTMSNVTSIQDILRQLPSAQPEVTEEEVKEYCRKRCLCIVDSALLKKYASAQPERKKGKWECCDILDYAQRASGRKTLRCPFCGYLTGEFM